MAGCKTIRLRTGRLGRHKPLYPWIFRTQLPRSYDSIIPGSIVTVESSDGKFIGRGYFNPRSEISARILTFKDEPVDEKLFDIRMRAAVKKREALLPRTDAYRAVFSEADALPGLIIDMYADTAVLQILTLGMEKFRAAVLDRINEIIHPGYIYEKSDSGFRKREGLKLREGWCGQPGSPRIKISEGAAAFIVDIFKGHKTGFYLDQRSSRLALHSVCKNRKVLDLFCYTGAFAVHAAISGAGEVLAADIKEDWLKLGRENAELNGVGGKIAFSRADSFDLLKGMHSSGKRFDFIILDPPSFIKSKHSIVTASKGYRQLNLAAMKCLNDDAVLATFSCSHNMPNETFSNILKEAAEMAGKRLTVIKRCHQAEDHPIVRNIPETEYLKGYFFKVSSK
jgi:23S rRNA (cytosine1962-C5)-methyltransferase